MNDEQLKLARELAGHPNFSGRRGMCIVSGRFPLFVMGDGVGYRDLMGGVPDLTDDATGGVLLGMLGAGWTCEHCEAANGASVWHVYPRGHTKPPETHFGVTLAEACARALLTALLRAHGVEVPGE